MTRRNDFIITSELKAPPEVVIYAFTTAQGWRNWLCDSCRFSSRSGSVFFMGWDGGFYSTGCIELVEKPESLSMTWRGKDDPGTTHVAITFKPTPTGTEVTLNHTGFGEEDLWREPFESSQKGWETGFENLESIFNTGEDLRQTRRPMLGVMSNNFSEKVAQDLGVPVTQGVRIDQPVPDMGAEKAGLRANDVIVEMNGTAIRGFEDLNIALSDKQAGETVSVAVFRGPKRQSFEMELSKRPTVDTPESPEEFAAELEKIQKDIFSELRQALQGVSENQANYSPSEDIWSAKETLAHLIESEQFSISWLTELMSDAEREFTGEGENQVARLQALLEVTPTIPELLDRFEQSQREYIALLRRAEPLRERKAVLWNLAQFDLLFPGTHERGHIEQISTAIQAAEEVGI